MMHPIIKPANNYVMHKEVISIHGVDKDKSKWPKNNEFEYLSLIHFKM
jgi:hypothetical protein